MYHREELRVFECVNEGCVEWIYSVWKYRIFRTIRRT